MFLPVCKGKQKLATGNCQYGEGLPRNERMGSLHGLYSSILYQQQQLHEDCCGPSSGCRPACVQHSASVNWYVLVLLFRFFVDVHIMHALKSFPRKEWWAGCPGDNISHSCLCAVPKDSGKIHKVLEAGSQPFIISETQLCSPSTVQSMQLDSKKVHT